MPELDKLASTIIAARRGKPSMAHLAPDYTLTDRRADRIVAALQNELSSLRSLIDNLSFRLRPLPSWTDVELDGEPYRRPSLPSFLRHELGILSWRQRRRLANVARSCARLFARLDAIDVRCAQPKGDVIVVWASNYDPVQAALRAAITSIDAARSVLKHDKTE